MGPDRENLVPENVSTIWKLNEAWPLKKDSDPFLRLLKLLKLKDNSTTAFRQLRFLIQKKELRRFLRTLKGFNTEKGHHQCLKVFNAEKGLHHFLRTLKVFNIEKGLHRFLEILILKNDPVTFLWLVTFFKIAIL